MDPHLSDYPQVYNSDLIKVSDLEADATFAYTMYIIFTFICLATCVAFVFITMKVIKKVGSTDKIIPLMLFMLQLSALSKSKNVVYGVSDVNQVVCVYRFRTLFHLLSPCPERALRPTGSAIDLHAFDNHQHFNPFPGPGRHAQHQQVDLLHSAHPSSDKYTTVPSQRGHARGPRRHQRREGAHPERA